MCSIMEFSNLQAHTCTVAYASLHQPTLLLTMHWSSDLATVRQPPERCWLHTLSKRG